MCGRVYVYACIYIYIMETYPILYAVWKICLHLWCSLNCSAYEKSSYTSCTNNRNYCSFYMAWWPLTTNPFLVWLAKNKWLFFVCLFRIFTLVIFNSNERTKNVTNEKKESSHDPCWSFNARLKWWFRKAHAIFQTQINLS